MKKIKTLIIALLTGQLTHATCLIALSDTARLGDYAFGGIVFWVDESGQHGLVCALTDQARDISWNDGLIYSEEVGKRNSQINMATIDFKKSENNQPVNLAVKVCDEYSFWEGGVLYDDWYLPSKEEVQKMYENRAIIDINATKNGGSYFTANNELSPTEFCNSPSWDQLFNYAYQDYDYKNSKFNVRAVRAF